MKSYRQKEIQGDPLKGRPDGVVRPEGRRSRVGSRQAPQLLQRDSQMSATLKVAKQDYITFRIASGRKNSTITKDMQCLRALLEFYGNVELDDINLDRFFASDRFRSASYRNSHVSVFRSFFEFCRNRGLMSPDRNPMFGYEHSPNPPAEKKYIPVGKFTDLLDAADEPRDRIVIALGLYLFVRQGEITGLKIRDVGRTHIGVRVWKTNQFDSMQVNTELRAELSEWLAIYARRLGALQPDWPLVPVLTPSWGKLVLDPSRPLLRPYKATQRALTRMGWTDDEIDGEGGHLLRRSGARALYFELRDMQGNERAMSFVQRRLHHSNRQQTERYIGVTADQKEMDDLLVDKPMFTTATRENVIPFRRRS